MQLRLAAIPVEDAVALHRLRANPAVVRTMGPSASVEQWRSYVRELDTQLVKLVGAYDAEGQLVGAAELSIQARIRQRHMGRLWILVAPSHEHRGIGRRLLAALIDAADGWWNLFRLEVDVPRTRSRSVDFLHAAGFRSEAVRRAEIRTEDGFEDAVRMARVRPGLVRPPESSAAPPVPPRADLDPDATLLIRSVRESDASGLHRLHDTDSVMEGTLFVPFESEREWRRRLGRREGTPAVLVALLDDEVVGTLGLFEHPMSRCRHSYHLGMAVSPTAQGRGVGDALMTHALAMADGWLGAHRVELDVYTDNHRAISLYRKHGFEFEGTSLWTAFRRGTYVDGHVMGRVRLPSAP